MPRAIGWAPALLPSRGSIIARPAFNPAPWHRRCDREIEKLAQPDLGASLSLPRRAIYRFIRRYNFLTTRDA
jgi:hypothetical protein